MTATKILFLDIDGVCNKSDTSERLANTHFIGIDPQLAERVRTIIDRTACSVVLSSTWRLGKVERDWVRKRVCDFIDVTPDFQEGRQYGFTARHMEIQAWLNEHPEVERFAILDDNPDAEIPSNRSTFFQTNWYSGLTQKVMERTIEYLNEGLSE